MKVLRDIMYFFGYAHIPTEAVQLAETVKYRIETNRNDEALVGLKELIKFLRSCRK